jgi:hypothetical protein
MSENMLRKQLQKYALAKVQLHKSSHLLRLIDKGNLAGFMSLECCWIAFAMHG